MSIKAKKIKKGKSQIGKKKTVGAKNIKLIDIYLAQKRKHLAHKLPSVSTSAHANRKMYKKKRLLKLFGCRLFSFFSHTT